MRRTDPISFRIKAEIKAELERLAKADKRSLSAYIEMALEEHIERLKRQAGKKR
jgi:predicted transcriptional regulator